jgi:adenylate cyclase
MFPVICVAPSSPAITNGPGSTAERIMTVKPDNLLLQDFLTLGLDYIARTIGYATAAVAIAVGVSLGTWPMSFLTIAAFCLVFPHLTHWLIVRNTPRSTPINRTLIQLDALLCGLLLGVMGAPASLSVLLFLMLSTALLLSGSQIIWSMGMAVCGIGIVAGIGIPDVGGHHVPPDLVIIITGLGVALYFTTLALLGVRQAEQLMSAEQKLNSQIEHFQELSHQVSRYVAPQIWDSIFNGRREAKLETQRKRLVIFFSDIVGFSSLSETMEADALTGLLNGYLTDMSKIALKFGATIDKFIGDGIMIFFGDPSSLGTKRDALACVSMAIEMRRHMLKMRKHWTEQGMTTPLQIRMGINTGYCTVGNFGTESRMDYTIVGREVNLASRLESEADAGEILISHETYSLVKDKIICRQRGTAMVKGFRDPVPLYQVMDYRRDLGANPGFMNHETEGFSLYLESDKVRDSEKDKVADALERAAVKLRQQMAHTRTDRPGRMRATVPVRQKPSTFASKTTGDNTAGEDEIVDE